MRDIPESKRGRPRGINPDKIDTSTPAYRIVVEHVGEGDLLVACERIDRDYNTVYGWLRRGVVPTRQQGNLSEKAERFGRQFPAEWYINAPEPAAEAA